MKVINFDSGWLSKIDDDGRKGDLVGMLFCRNFKTVLLLNGEFLGVKLGNKFVVDMIFDI